jgi:peptidoglycan/xylan/chitin deacetylase (PgdA/CDA1 family)
MFAGAIFQGDPNKPLVALTFDDGPSSYTLAVLSALASEGVHATFFDVGTRVVARPDLVQAELVGGNEVENHSYFHNNLGSRTGLYNFPYDVADLKRTARAMMGAGAPRPHFFRPPYGSLQSTLGSASLSIDEVPVTWNVDPRDWSRPGTDEIIARVLGSTRSGSIVLMHDGGGDRSQTVAAVVPIVEGLRARGYTLVRLDELVGAMIGDPCATPPHDGCPTLEAGPTIDF